MELAGRETRAENPLHLGAQLHQAQVAAEVRGRLAGVEEGVAFDLGTCHGGGDHDLALEQAQEFAGFALQGARVVVQGFGSVGQHAAAYLAERGASLVGVADSRGARVHADGFDLQALLTHKRGGGSVVDFAQGQTVEEEALAATECDIWIPAARPDVIRADNAALFAARVIAQGANIPATPEAERILAERGVLVLPDFVANAGGVICAAVEYHQGSEQQALATIADKIRVNVRAVLERCRDRGELPREAALAIARQRVLTAMSFRNPKM